MASQEKAQAAFNRIQELGGHGVWESDMVVISLDSTSITDEDLTVFNDFDFVEVLSMSNTQITDAGLAHLKKLGKLKTLTMIDTKVTPDGVADLRTTLPHAEINTVRETTAGKTNPFTGEPIE